MGCCVGHRFAQPNLYHYITVKKQLTTATRRKTKNLFLLLLLAVSAVSPWLMFLNLLTFNLTDSK
jgi:hypothetical protein